MTRKNICKVLAMLLVTNVFCLLWQWMEVLIYGAIEGRIVDDIMMLLMMPFFYCTISFIFEKVEERKNVDADCGMRNDEDALDVVVKFRPMGQNDKAPVEEVDFYERD